MLDDRAYIGGITQTVGEDVVAVRVWKGPYGITGPDVAVELLTGRRGPSATAQGIILQGKEIDQLLGLIRRAGDR